MAEQKIPLIVVAGPTASGKTALSIEICKEFGGEVVSADSMQIYKHMNIGTAKPDDMEKKGIPHHLLDIIDPNESFSVADYTKLAHQKIREIYENGKIPVLVGGTGLYINSVVDNIAFVEDQTDQNYREELFKTAGEKGNEYLHELLAEIDPETAKCVHPNNLGRVVRALEIYKLTGKTMSQTRAESKLVPSPYEPIMVALTTTQRQTLYNRINDRVDIMVEQGLVNEAKELINKGFSKTAFQAIGYKEIINYINGKESFEEATEKLKMETRRYAKRQLTWFKKDERYYWIKIDNKECYDIIKTEAFNYIRERL